MHLILCLCWKHKNPDGSVARPCLQANQIFDMAPGTIFVQRNVGNQAMHTDMNVMSCLEYAVKALKVSVAAAHS